MPDNTPVIIDSDNILRCPHCDFKYTHQLNMEIHARHEDLQATTLRVNLKSGETTNQPLHQNPSDRRQGLIIEFECENACPPLLLAISQHKGRTFIEWLNTPATQLQNALNHQDDLPF